MTLAAVGFVAADFFSTAVRIPVLWYQPLERRFFVAGIASGAAMDFYGRLLFCAVAAAFIGALAALALKSAAPKTLVQWESRALVWLAAVLLFAGALQVTQLVRRHPVPLELPR